MYRLYINRFILFLVIVGPDEGIEKLIVCCGWKIKNKKKTKNFLQMSTNLVEVIVASGNSIWKICKKLINAGIEPATFCVLTIHYTVKL